MTGEALPEEFDPGVVAEIKNRLASVRAQGIRIGLAIESGSRAWGFASPDSDYDCRFVYVRKADDHLGLHPHRDVIEFPIIGDVDTGGWDLKKALLLALKGNAVIVEWLKSPITYEEEPGFRERLQSALDDIVDPARVALHYAGLYHSQMVMNGTQAVKIKKILYALRPALALLWLDQRDFAALPPMNMLEVMQETRLAPEAKEVILQLVARKKITRELGVSSPPPELLKVFGDFERRLPEIRARLAARPPGEDKLSVADEYYRSEVLRGG